uniref:hypothetical protein n=1 Tax=Streptomyces sp. HSW2009 TaxID=3142890 RepID=UPI0032EABDAE
MLLSTGCAAECPQRCRTTTGTFVEDRHVDDYREALFGWYAAIQRAHACVVRAVRWFTHVQPSDPRRSETFTDWLNTPAPTWQQCRPGD